MSTKNEPEALRLATGLDDLRDIDYDDLFVKSSVELRRQHAEIQRLKAAEQTLRGEREVMVGVLRECDQVISTLEPESTDEDDGLRKLLRAVKRITLLNLADRRDLLSSNGGIPSPEEAEDA